MSIRDIIGHFNQKDSLWIEVNEVRDQVRAAGFADEIKFHFVSMQEAVVRGFIHRYWVSSGVYGDPQYCADIYIANTLDDDWRRVVAVKELLHIVDDEGVSASSKEAVDSLLENMALPADLRNSPKASYYNDKIRLITAISILIPPKIREEARKLHAEGRISARELSELARVPTRFAELVLGPRFEPMAGLEFPINDDLTKR